MITSVRTHLSMSLLRGLDVMDYIFLISGPIAVGKSDLTKQLERRFLARRISTSQLLIDHGTPPEREDLIRRGIELDTETKGKWVADFAREKMENERGLWIIDAVRTRRQVEHLREAFGQRVIHVHLTAPLSELEARYAHRERAIREFDTYEEARRHGTEVNIEELAEIADFVVPAFRCKPESELARVTAGLGLYPLAAEQSVDVVVGGQYGSEGKGNICAHLAPNYDVLIRVGGPNAGHKVAHPAFRYIQMPSGTLSNPSAKILIGAGATLSVEQVLEEIEALKLTEQRLTIDPNAMIIEPSDRAAEAKNGDSIGSTKKGVGVATARKIAGRFETIFNEPVRLAKDVPELSAYVRCVQTELENAYAANARIMLEGTQGTDLSLHHAKYPHVTSRETTASGCLADAGISARRVRKIIMVTRTYPIRVGGESGDLPHEITYKDIADRCGLREEDISGTEVGSVSGKQRRMAEFDWHQARRSASLNGATDIALTFADYIDGKNRLATRFEQLSEETRNFISELERVTNAPVSLISKAFNKRGVIDRRAWR